jgi:hypothetical protein
LTTTIKLSTAWWSNAHGGSGIDFWFAVVESVVLITVDLRWPWLGDALSWEKNPAVTFHRLIRMEIGIHGRSHQLEGFHIAQPL